MTDFDFDSIGGNYNWMKTYKSTWDFSA